MICYAHFYQDSSSLNQSLDNLFTDLASFLVRTILFGMVYASGIYYVAILKDMKTSNAAAAWVGSILIAFVSMACKSSSFLNCMIVLRIQLIL